MSDGLPVRIYAEINGGPPRLLGERVLPDKHSAVRDVAGLLTDIAEALHQEASFLEIIGNLRPDE